MTHTHRLALTAACLMAAAAPAAAQSPAAFHPGRMETVLYGAAYYPEYTPSDRLEQDVELMSKAGITVVRVGESTWSSWEPRDGHFEFAWMERVLDRLHQAKIKVILGTPTYSIPTWLYRQFPDIAVTHNSPAPPLGSPFSPSYPSAQTPGYYGPRQNYDFLHPEFRSRAERVVRRIVSRFKDHPAVIGYQIDNETAPNGVWTKYTAAAFLQHLQRKYKTPATINRLWGLAYWGQLVDAWDDLPPRNGILNPGYKLEWENFQHEIVTEYLASQARIVREYKRPHQFILHDFSGGAHTNLDQWEIARHLDVVGENPYFETQDRFHARGIWFTGDVGRSLKKTNYFVTETNAQTIGWDSRTQYPQYPGQLRQAVYANLAAGANLVAYWHWHSLHYGQETYWKGVLSHDLLPNRTYAEVTRVAAELKKLGPDLVNLAKSNKVAILFSADSANAISYMPFSDRVGYQTILAQMYDALYDLNVEPDFVPAAGAGADWRDYRVLLVPPLYSASDETLHRLAAFVKGGGHVVMSFKSGFTNEHSTVRAELAPGPLREAAGIHYQEFTSLAAPVALKPDRFGVGAEHNKGSVWQEFLTAGAAEVLLSFDHKYWPFPAVTRNRHGQGTLTYQATHLTAPLQREILRDTLAKAGLTGPDQALPPAVKVRHGRNSKGRRLHYYFNFSGQPQQIRYPHGAGVNLLNNQPVPAGATLSLPEWDLAIVSEP